MAAAAIAARERASCRSTKRPRRSTRSYTSCRRTAESAIRPGDEPCAALERHVRPRPLQQDQQPVPEADQIEDVDAEPGHPRYEAAEVEPADSRDRGGAADRGERAFVAVVERAQRLPLDGALDVVRRVEAFLNRRRRDARHVP